MNPSIARCVAAASGSEQSSGGVPKIISRPEGRRLRKVCEVKAWSWPRSAMVRMAVPSKRMADQRDPPPCPPPEGEGESRPPRCPPPEGEGERSPETGEGVADCKISE